MRSDLIQTRGYDPRISGDYLSLKIASYPATARFIAGRLQGEGDTVCELCCGIGVSLVELSKSFKKVVGVDNSPKIIEDCRKNLEHAGVPNFELLCGDVSDRNFLRSIKADVVLYDIPYWSTHAGQVDPQKQNPDMSALITNVRGYITDKIVMYVPTHMTYQHVSALLGECEFMQVYVNGKHDRNFIFFGSLMKRAGTVRADVSF